jgi:hypothetical protein
MTRSRCWFRALLVVASTSVCLLAASAHADEADDGAQQKEKSASHTKSAFDLEYVIVEGRALDNGVGGALRLGQQFGGVLLSLTPEIGGSYHSLNGVYDASLYRGFVGLRLSLGAVIEPGIFGHVGYGHIDFRDVSGPLDRSHGALTYDAGVTLDFTLLPVLDVGAHAAYNGLAGKDDFDRIHWISAGGHFSVQF